MEKICSKCARDPTTHSFRKIAEKGNIWTYYTNPTKSRLYKDTEGILSHYENALNELGENKWRWIFDSEGFDMRHALEVKTGVGIAKLITNKFGKNLDEVIIINPTWHIKLMLAVVYPFLTDDTKNRVKVLGDRYYTAAEFT